eukprot:5758594-Pleurochrysis_carterae.AAC.2
MWQPILAFARSGRWKIHCSHSRPLPVLIWTAGEPGPRRAVTLQPSNPLPVNRGELWLHRLLVAALLTSS